MGQIKYSNLYIVTEYKLLNKWLPGMDQEYSVAVAKYDYKAESEGELTIRKNEKLQIIDDSQPWWKVQNEKSISGYVPSNYLTRKDSVKGKKTIIDNLKNKVLKNKRTSLED